MAHRRLKQIENSALVGVCSSIHVGIFDLDHVKVIWGHPVHFSKNWPVNRKWLTMERMDENLCFREGCVYNMHVGTFDLEHVKVI